MTAPPLRVQQLTVGPLQENCWLLVDPTSTDAVLIDPGDEPDRLLEAVTDAGATLRAIWLTHAHFDHVGGVTGIRRHAPVPVYLHPADRVLYDRAAASAAAWNLTIEAPDAEPLPLAEGETLALGRFTFDVWHVPGHAPGHVAFIGHGLCISGDLLFAGSIGRTDFPLCDAAAMHRSLQRVAALPPETRVLTGHGVSTTIGQEREANPFLSGAARPLGT